MIYELFPAASIPRLFVSIFALEYELCGCAHIIQTRPMHRHFDNLDRRQISRLDRRVRRQRNLRETERAGIRTLGWAGDLEDGDHREGEVLWSRVGSVGPEAHVDVEEGRGVPLEPAGLDGDGAAVDGPGCAVAGGAHAAAWGRLVGEMGRERGLGMTREEKRD